MVEIFFTFQANGIVNTGNTFKEFLEDMFQYNPDYHVRSAYKPNPNDPERNIIDSPAGHLAIHQLKKADPEFSERMVMYERELLIKEKQKNSKITEDESVSKPDITKNNKKKGKKTLKTSDVSTETDNSKLVDATVRKYCTEMIPPADIFHRLQYYYDSNYEELKEIMNDLYCDKPELETALNPYAWHNNEDDADEFINKLPNGYNTMIGENGVRLSGGQKQRISIARAILKESSIILLDEATSSLDTESEEIVQNAINNLTKNKTTLVIAHRLSTIHNADKIFVMKHGEIINSGNHDFLINNCEEYKSLYQKQLK